MQITKTKCNTDAIGQTNKQNKTFFFLNAYSTLSLLCSRLHGFFTTTLFRYHDRLGFQIDFQTDANHMVFPQYCKCMCWLNFSSYLYVQAFENKSIFFMHNICCVDLFALLDEANYRIMLLDLLFSCFPLYVFSFFFFPLFNITKSLTN